MMKRGFVAILAAWGLIVGSVVWADTARAEDEVLCSSNMAYRNSPAHKDGCKEIGINSHGGGGPNEVPAEEGEEAPAP